MADEQNIPLNVLRSYSPHPDKLDLTGLTQDEITHGIKSSKLPDYIRYKQYLTDTNEALAQLAEMIIQFAVNLGLDPDQTMDWARKLQQAVPQSEFDSWIATLLDGGPSIFVNTLSELQAKYPNGAAGVALVRETDPAKIYVWNGTVWEDFGNYQGIELKNNTVSEQKTTFINTDGYAEKYERGYVAGIGISVMDYILSDTSRSVFYEVKPNTQYTVSKDLSDRFRILSTSDYPSRNANFVRFIKDEKTTQNESLDTHFTFNTIDNENYIIVTVSRIDNEPRVRLDEGKVDFGLNKLEFEDSVISENIKQGINLFSGNYEVGAVLGSVHDETSGLYQVTGHTEGRTAIIPVKRNTDYGIYKTISNRFRVALSEDYPKHGSSLYVLKDETVGGGDADKYFSLNTQNYNYLLVTVCNYTVDIPSFVQIQIGSEITQLESYGYKFYPEAQPIGNGNVSSDTLSVESFRLSPMTDSAVIQMAFDSANGQVVSFESGRKYTLNKTVKAIANKVIGLEFNNALLSVDGDFAAFEYKGGKSTPGADPTIPENPGLFNTEMNAFIEKVRVTSETPGEGVGIILEGMFHLNASELFLHSLKNGLIIKGMNRNLNFANSSVYNMKGNGIEFLNANIHQLNMSNIHGSYCRNVIRAVDSQIANWQIAASDLENGTNNFGTNDSIISIETTENGKSILWELAFTGTTIQDHAYNTKPIVNIDCKPGEVLDLIISSSTIGNGSPNAPTVYLNGVSNYSLSDNNFSGNQSENVIELGDDNKVGRIIGNKLQKGIKYGNVHKLLIANNVGEGMSELADFDDGNVKIVNNLI